MTKRSFRIIQIKLIRNKRKVDSENDILLFTFAFFTYSECLFIFVEINRNFYFFSIGSKAL